MFLQQREQIRVLLRIRRDDQPGQRVGFVGRVVGSTARSPNRAGRSDDLNRQRSRPAAARAIFAPAAAFLAIARRAARFRRRDSRQREWRRRPSGRFADRSRPARKRPARFALRLSGAASKAAQSFGASSFACGASAVAKDAQLARRRVEHSVQQVIGLARIVRQQGQRQIQLLFRVVGRGGKLLAHHRPGQRPMPAEIADYRRHGFRIGGDERVDQRFRFLLANLDERPDARRERGRRSTAPARRRLPCVSAPSEPSARRNPPGGSAAACRRDKAASIRPSKRPTGFDRPRGARWPGRRSLPNRDRGSDRSTASGGTSSSWMR